MASPQTCSHSLPWYEYKILRQYVENSWEFKIQSVAEEIPKSSFLLHYNQRHSGWLGRGKGRPMWHKPRFTRRQKAGLCVWLQVEMLGLTWEPEIRLPYFQLKEEPTSLGRRGFECSFSVAAAAWFWAEPISTSPLSSSHTSGNLSQLSPDTWGKRSCNCSLKINILYSEEQRHWEWAFLFKVSSSTKKNCLKINLGQKLCF